MSRFFAVVERDLRKFVRNPLVMLVSIIMPILYLIILGNSFQGELKNLPVALVKMDRGPYAEKMERRLRSLEAGPGKIALYDVSDQGFAMKGLKNGLFKAVIVVPPDFSRDVLHKKTAEIGLFLDNTDPISSEAVRGAITLAFSDMEGEFIPVREERSRPRLREVEVYKKIDYDQTLIPGVVIMAIFLGAMTTGVFNTVMDKFLGTDESYLLTPLRKIDIVMGLLTSGLFITTILAFLVLFISSLILGIYLWGILTPRTLFYLFIVVILSILCLQGILFLILGRADHPRIVGVLGGFLNVILFFPSGAIYPVESFPRWLRLFARINPETYSVHALRAILFKGAGLAAVKWDLAFLLVFAAIAVAVATAVFKREL
ncbi:MAG: ABC transporter permease [Deltaproteobacteria bacterium]|nr:ABC transporter permease [Deltaproteobacteria bacterium]